MKISKAENTTNRAEIEKLEKHLNIKIPEEYCEFLLEHNGGTPVENVFEAQKYGGSMLGSLYGIYNNYELGNIQSNIEVFKNRIPDKFIPIGCDQLGNQIILGVTGKYNKRVYFWWHEAESDTDKPTYKNIYKIADSFNEFTSSLTEFVYEKTGTVEDYFLENDTKSIKELVASGWDVNTPFKNGITAIQLMVVHNDIEIVKLLMEKGANLNDTLSRAVCNGLPETVTLLLDAGIDVNEKDNSGVIAIHDAIMEGNLDAVRILIAYGADLHYKNEFGKSAIDIAKNVRARGEKDNMDEIVELIEKSL